jgi:hypothetical protein
VPTGLPSPSADSQFEAFDVVPALIERAEECYGKSGARFAVADAREPFSRNPVDLALLL